MARHTGPCKPEESFDPPVGNLLLEKSELCLFRSTTLSAYSLSFFLFFFFVVGAYKHPAYICFPSSLLPRKLEAPLQRIAHVARIVLENREEKTVGEMQTHH